MGVCLMFMILLGCKLSEATQSHNACLCNGELQVFCGQDRKVYVPCPYVKASVMTFELHKDNNVTTKNIKCEHNNSTFNCTPSHEVIIRETQHQLSISFILTEPSHGIYKCQGRGEFPPPVKTLPSEVQVQVGEPQCKSKTAANPKNHHWIWIVAVLVLVIYGITVTIIALVYKVKLKKVDSHSDYINTKPRAPRGPKKRGVQNPIPRHF